MPCWPDRDQDACGDTDFSFVGCFQPREFYPVVPGDCNDLNAAIHPGATEICTGLDDDCDGLIDENNVRDRSIDS